MSALWLGLKLWRRVRAEKCAANAVTCPWPDQQAVIGALRVAFVDTATRHKPKSRLRFCKEHTQSSRYQQNAGQYPIAPSGTVHRIALATAIIARSAVTEVHPLSVKRCLQ
jgi:hypothetical protein